MFPGQQRYPEGRFPPERGYSHNWHVHCMTGALQVLQTQEHVTRLQGHSAEFFTINFANGSAADTHPGDQLWETLREIANAYQVEVYKLSLDGGYVPWKGAAGDLGRFDAIRISSKCPVPA